ncbi:MAG: ATP-binding protein [Gammaproteobacteria bacterium]
MLRNLSFRYKIPLRATILVLVTATIVTASLMFRTYDDLRQDLLISSESMGRVLAKTLVPALLHDDVWQAFEIINSPYAPALHEDAIQAEIIMVLDTAGRVFVSTRPRQYPVLKEIAEVGPEQAFLLHAVSQHTRPTSAVIEPPRSDHLYMITPLISDDVPLGTLVMGYSRSLFMPRFLNIAKRAAFITLLSLAVLLPMSWYWGHHMAKPLVKLADCMGRIGATIPQHLTCELYESKDEIGQVGASFKRMLLELKEKESLEKQMVISDRLAAIGRLTAGIAHEINNPLGGMLNAINTFKCHGTLDPRTVKTLSLLERGLLQIRDTVGALLVEAKPGSQRLSPQDIEDVRTLVASDIGKKSIRLVWDNALSEPVDLPSTPVRQTLINLVLNAVQATQEKGHVRCHVSSAERHLHIEVENDGKHIPPEQMKHLFEPFSPLSEAGHGLGLWVSYQIIQQLNGEFHVESVPGHTCFTITLPIGELAS